MEKIGFILIAIGIVIMGYAGIKIYQGSQNIEKYTPEPNLRPKSNPNNKSSPQKTETKIDTGDDEKVEKEKIMSNELNRYEIGEKVAKLKIPKIGNQYSVYWGTDDKTLDKGVGMYVSKWTVTPDFQGHVVMTGHRDTVFVELGKLEEGDVLEVCYDDEIYTYLVDNIWITDPEDRSVIVDKDEPTLTLVTCYPFDFIGAAPERYIVQAKGLDN